MARVSVRGVALLLLVGLGLSGCSYLSHDMTWTKAGVSEDEAWSDLDSCESMARAATKADRGIDQDIAAAQGGNAGGADYGLTTNMSGYQTQERYNSWVAECMTGFGYQRVK
jgi:hypothetical protein